MSTPHTKVARQEMIKDWITQGSIHSQVEIVDRLKMIGDNGAALMMIDDKLSLRLPPAPAAANA